MKLTIYRIILCVFRSFCLNTSTSHYENTKYTLVSKVNYVESVRWCLWYAYARRYYPVYSKYRFFGRLATVSIPVSLPVYNIIMVEELQKAHLYYDEINKIRVIENTVHKETDDLKVNCKDYDTKVRDFGKTIGILLDMLKELGDNVEKQKMAAIGATNFLKSIEKDRESEQARLQAEISDKSLVLEQLDSEYDALQILEATQTETIEYLTQLR